MRSPGSGGRRHATRGVQAIATIAFAVACGGPPAAPVTPDPNDSASVRSAAELALSLPALHFAMTTDGGRIGRAPVRVTEASGIVDPAHDRGTMEYRPQQGGQTRAVMDVRWSAMDLWVAIAARGPATASWLHTTRASSRETGFLGATQEEPRALLWLVATAAPDEITATGAGGHDGIRDWVVTVPLGRAGEAFVPPYHFARLRHDRPDDLLALQVSLRDGLIVRIRYEVDAAPPRRYITTYTWTTELAVFDAEVPPRGTINEMP